MTDEMFGWHPKLMDMSLSSLELVMDRKAMLQPMGLNSQTQLSNPTELETDSTECLEGNPCASSRAGPSGFKAHHQLLAV